jgi:hypothetical protein
MSSDLSPKLNELIAQELALGHYSSEEELLTEAVHLLSQSDALRKQIQAGTRQLQNGEFTDYDSDSLRRRFAGAKVSSPRLGQPDQIADFRMEVRKISDANQA